MKSINGPVVPITVGGSGSGASIAEHFCAQGSRVPSVSVGAVRAWKGCSVAAGLTALLGSWSGSFAAERILRYDSDIMLHTDASMTVTETIEVVAEGDQIRRGIYRDFPVRYRDPAGNRYSVDFDVVAVERDGAPEPYFVQSSGDNERLYIGREEVFLAPDRYVYRITYRTGRQLGHFDGYDELYWNVTGNHWVFDIDRVSATVTLPQAVPPESVQLYGYTGPAGAKGADYVSQAGPDGRIRFRTTRPLAAGEGLTISVAFAPGVIARPSRANELRYALRDRRPEVFAFTGVVLLLLYYWRVWSRVGRDPEEGVIVPRFEPPAGLSPAAVRYVDRMGFDNRAFAAAIINMAVKGYLVIDEEDKEYALRRTSPEAREPLSRGEQSIADKLFKGRRTVRLRNANHRVVSRAIASLQKLFETEYNKVYFLRNSVYLLPGLVIAIVTVTLTLLFAGTMVTESVFMIIWLTMWSVGVSFLWIQRRLLMAIIFSAFEVAALSSFAAMLSPPVMGLLVLMVVINVVFFYLLRAPTLLGRKTMDEIKGFREYLEVAEEDRLQVLHPPERTPQLFERFLPYALALGVEQRWAEKFADVLSVSLANASAYQPDWYRGTRFRPDRVSGFTSSLSAGLTSAISSSSTAPGSRSGSGGGGSSGGGGGGGGGGGW